jgi:hypothetical protein
MGTIKIMKAGECKFIKLFKNSQMQGVQDLRSESYFLRTLHKPAPAKAGEGRSATQ